jgi:glycosyltransferase involved in cell wall biosynthesis
MKIVHICAHFNTTIEYQELALVRQQLNEGHLVIVITSDCHFNFPNFEESYKPVLGDRYIGTGVFYQEGIKIIRLKEVNRPHFLYHLKGLRKSIKAEKPDAIFCHGYEIGLLPVQSYLKNIPTVIDSHYIKLHKIKYSWQKKTIVNLVRLLKLLILSNKSNIYFVGITEESIEYLKQNLIPSSKVKFIPLGVNKQVFFFEKNIRDYFREELGISKNEVVICYSGKVEKYKGVKIILEALSELRNPSIILIIIGNGSMSYKNELIDYIKNNKLSNQVKFVPFCSKIELNKYYNASDIAVFPLSITISQLEASAVRLPIIIEDMQASKHRLLYHNGFAIKNGDIIDIVNKINILIDDTKLRQQMGAQSEKLVDKYYTWEIINNQFMQLIKNNHIN